MALSEDHSIAISTSADSTLGHYDARDGQMLSREAKMTERGGRASAAVRSDKKVFATGGWDGKVRVPSTATFRPLANLSFFKETVQALAFGPDMREGDDSRAEEELDEDEDESASWDVQAEQRKEEAHQWLAAGGKDGRIALWNIHFEKHGPG